MKKAISIWDKNIIRQALVDAIKKLSPRKMLKNPVMFVVEVGAAFLTLRMMANMFVPSVVTGFELQITLWLWFTVFFANFAEAMAEGRGKAQADTLRRSRTETTAKLLRNGGDITETVAATKLRVGDIVYVEAGE